MNWYQSLTWLEIIFGTLFILMYAGYIYRIKRLAAYFKQNANMVWIKFGLRSAYMLLLIIAILGPSFGAMKKEIRTLGKDVFVLVDASASMQTKDVAPSRLERLQYELNQLVPNLNADRIGLIAFSSEAVMQSPLTYDQSALLLYNRLLNPNIVPAAAANFEPALELAYQKFMEHPSRDTTSNRARTVLLFSDGEDFSPDLRPLLQRYYKEDIRVYTIGVGTEQGGLIPMGKSFKRDKNGERVISRLQPDRLKDIADKTQGRYFEINNQVNETQQLARTINNLEGEQRESRTIDITANKYFYPLLAALILIITDILLTFTVIKI